MRILYNETLTGIDISSPYILCEFTVTSNILIMATAALSQAVGGGGYNIQVYTDDYLAVPDKPVTVDDGVTDFKMQSRNIFVPSGSIYKLIITGLPSDISVNVTTTLVDSSVMHSDDIEDILVPTITNAIEDSVEESISNVTINQERVVLGPCTQPVVETLAAAPQSVVQSPQVVRQRVVSGYLMPVNR